MNFDNPTHIFLAALVFIAWSILAFFAGKEVEQNNDDLVGAAIVAPFLVMLIFAVIAALSSLFTLIAKNI